MPRWGNLRAPRLPCEVHRSANSIQVSRISFGEAEAERSQMIVMQTGYGEVAGYWLLVV